MTNTEVIFPKIETQVNKENDSQNTTGKEAEGGITAAGRGSYQQPKLQQAAAGDLRGPSGGGIFAWPFYPYFHRPNALHISMPSDGMMSCPLCRILEVNFVDLLYLRLFKFVLCNYMMEIWGSSKCKINILGVIEL